MAKENPVKKKESKSFFSKAKSTISKRMPSTDKISLKRLSNVRGRKNIKRSNSQEFQENLKNTSGFYKEMEEKGMDVDANQEPSIYDNIQRFYEERDKKTTTDDRTEDFHKISGKETIKRSNSQEFQENLKNTSGFYKEMEEKGMDVDANQEPSIYDDIKEFYEKRDKKTTTDDRTEDFHEISGKETIKRSNSQELQENLKNVNDFYKEMEEKGMDVDANQGLSIHDDIKEFYEERDKKTTTDDRTEDFHEISGKETIKRSNSQELQENLKNVNDFYKEMEEKGIDVDANQGLSIRDNIQRFYEERDKKTTTDDRTKDFHEISGKETISQNIQEDLRKETSKENDNINIDTNKRVRFADNVQIEYIDDIDKMSNQSKKLPQSKGSEMEKNLKGILKKPSQDLSNISAIEQSSKSRDRSQGR